MVNSNQNDSGSTQFNPGFFTRAFIGVKNHPWRFLGAWFLTYTAIWAILEPVSTFFPEYFQYNNTIKFSLIVALSLLIAIMYRMPKVKIVFDIKGSNTKVEVTFGDLFQQEGDIAFAANEFFDCDIAIIKRFTLHGKFIGKYYPDPSDFAREIDASLARAHIRGEKTDRRDASGNPRDRNVRYPIGTTACLHKVNRTYFLFALTRDSGKEGTEASILDLWMGLSELWNEVRENRSSDTINIPLIGSGYADIGLPNKLLLQIILSSILTSTKVKRFAATVRIVLQPRELENIELDKLEEVWSL